MSFLLDTCVLSEFTKPKPNKGLTRWLDEQEELELFISVLTLGELRKGIVQLPDGKRRDALAQWLTEELIPRFADRTLPISSSVALHWGQLQGTAVRRGEPLPIIDALLGATALENELVVVTHNTQDIVRTGAQVFDPWS